MEYLVTPVMRLSMVKIDILLFTYGTFTHLALNNNHSLDNKKFKDRKCTTQKEIRQAYWKYIDGIMSSETESELETGKT
jgi:hypothetical protein